ncbi:MAG: hypothetical protein HeimC2_15550 [Candidatus Heimdallarchaeota archaeon LC_2]|nr:MAG: hypothetical protein HeimC2_15550 [Candidatus Heimdallarchaeota archaeon LC_2]
MPLDIRNYIQVALYRINSQYRRIQVNTPQNLSIEGMGMNELNANPEIINNFQLNGELRGVKHLFFHFHILFQ